MEVWRSYPYLWQEVIWASLVAAWLCWRVSLPLRRRIVQASLLFTFNIPAAVFFQPDYWNPRRLGGWPFGVEDFLFAFSASATVLLIHVRWTPAWRAPGPVGMSARRLFAWSLPGYAFFFAVRGAAGSGMTAMVATFAVVGSLILLARSRSWRPPLVCALLFGAFYWAQMKLCFWAWPAFAADWSSRPPWGSVLLWGVPLGEFAWAAAHGFFWSALAGEIFGVAPARAAERDVPVGAARSAV
jgi:hypothetical protein